MKGGGGDVGKTTNGSESGLGGGAGGRTARTVVVLSSDGVASIVAC
jgi:hypothetical protein